MPKKLKNLKLAELSLVDNPANPHAKVAIFKRQETETKKETTMSFSNHVASIRKSTKCSGVVALQKARQLFPDAFEKHQNSGLEAQQSFQKQMRQPTKFLTDFDQLAQKLAIENPHLPGTTIMRMARIERPDLFAAHQLAG